MYNHLYDRAGLFNKNESTEHPEFKVSFGDHSMTLVRVNEDKYFSNVYVKFFDGEEETMFPLTAMDKGQLRHGFIDSIDNFVKQIK